MNREATVSSPSQGEDQGGGRKKQHTPSELVASPNPHPALSGLTSPLKGEVSIGTASPSFSAIGGEEYSSYKLRRIEPQKTKFARKLRTGATDCERKLWNHLKQRQLGRHRFRRQYVIDPYITDFACVEMKLIIELDGGQHNGSISDAQREAFLKNQGWHVLRFWNNDVMENINGVVETIKASL